MADIDEKVVKYLNIYEPLIRLLEKGVAYVLRSGYIDVINVSSFPVNNWMKRVKKHPIDISDLKNTII